MPIPVVCPNCGSQELVVESYQGSVIPCKKCGQNMTVPTVAQGPSAGTVAATGMGAGMVVLIVGLVSVFILLACGGVMIALLLPAVQAARSAARRMQSSNNIKQIMLGLHNYEQVHGTFPPAYIADENGKPMHSWRVLILPYIEQNALSQQYDMSKPWDSPENLAVAAQVPMVFRSPSDPAKDKNTTSYVLIAGKGTAFDGSKAVSTNDIPDGLSNTIGVVEIGNSGILWTQPTDLDAAALDFVIRDMRNAQPGQINSPQLGGVVAGFLDGAVRVISTGTDPAELRKAATMDGGEAVMLP